MTFQISTLEELIEACKGCPFEDICEEPCEPVVNSFDPATRIEREEPWYMTPEATDPHYYDNPFNQV